MKEYRYLSVKQISKYEPEMKRLKVSEVARSKRGFLTAYKKAGTKNNLSDDWRNRRDGFIKRHMAQYKPKQKRRELALIAWAYKP
jgi:hypothetical protein